MEQKWFSCLSLVFWIHVEKNVAPCVEVDLCCMACRGGGVGGADHVERCSIEAHARILRFFLFFYCWLVRSDISFSPDPMSNHTHLHPAFGSHLVVGNFSTVLLTLSLPSWSVADSFFFFSSTSVDHFYTMLFSTLKQTHCTRVTCDSESAAFDQPQSVMKFHGCCNYQKFRNI